MFTSDKALPGTDSPAAQRFFCAMISAKSFSEMRPRPTSMSVPTTARTMLRRKRSAVISNRPDFVNASPKLRFAVR